MLILRLEQAEITFPLCGGKQVRVSERPKSVKLVCEDRYPLRSGSNNVRRRVEPECGIRRPANATQISVGSENHRNAEFQAVG